MNAIGRKQHIILKLQKENYVDTNELAAELAVSAMTIRRDLNALAKSGLITVQHGGATLNSGSLFEFNMAMKNENQMTEKMRIAKKCLEYVHGGDSVYLDAGTTVSCLAPLLKGKENVLIMTHSLLAMDQLSDTNLHVIMCPGEYRSDSLAFIGSLTDEFISQFQIDTLFLGVEGIDLNGGFSVPHIADGTTKRTLVKKARQVICMADSSKFDSAYYFSIAPLQDADLIVTDSGISPAVLERYTSAGIRIVVA